MQVTKSRALAIAATLALAACSGSTGTPGAAGAPGPAGAAGVGTPGAAGAPGVSTGGVAGKLQYEVAGVKYAASNVSVTSDPACGTGDVSDADGSYGLSGCAAGVYKLIFAGTGYTKLEVPNVSILAGKEIVLDKILVASNPLVVAAKTMPNPAGFNALVTLGVNVSGGTAPYTYKWAARAANPTAAALSSTTAEAPTFTTGTIAGIVAGGKVIGFASSNRAQWMPVTAQHVTQSTYNFDVTVTDAVGYTKTATVAVVPVTLAQASRSVPVGTLVIADVPGNAAAAAFTKPAASAAALNDASTPYPWFVADVAGDYAVGALATTAATFVTSNPNCGGCHASAVLLTDAQRANVAAKFKAWNNSAHGNHFFKYFKYDGANLVPKDPAAPLPTANATVFWKAADVLAPMTTLEFGLTGAEGTHYGASCMGCHSVGYNLALNNNNGFDDAMKAAGWAFPDLTKAFTGLTGDPTGDLVTPAPQFGVWDAMPASVKAYAGMQCESCHGPLGRHVTLGATTPTGEYSIAACAICHDKPNNHDRVALWRQSGHANLELALEEGTGSGSCARCHSAQGFARYAKDTTVSSVDSGATEADVQPQTCAACHDSHSTTVRITGETPVPIAAGFTVAGAGSGALCMTCHNGRRGAKGDAIAMTSFQTPHAPTQAEVLMGQNAYFAGPTGYQVSRHAAVAETCVGCHMKTAVEGLRMTNTNHTFGFKVNGVSKSGSICKECHGEEVNGEALEGTYGLRRAEVAKQIGEIFKAAVAGADGLWVTPAGAGHGAPSGNPLKVLLTNIQAIDVSGSSLVFTLNAAVDVTFGTTTSSVTVITSSAGNIKDATNTFALAGVNGTVSKSLWNLGLVNDGSKSIHNPSFVFEVLQNTLAALKAAQPAAACTAAGCI